MSSEDRTSDSSDPFLREIARIDDDVAPDVRRPGTRVGRFVIEGELGRGGMGVVYRALDVSLGRTVALKILPTADPERRGRFLREACAAAALDHPNVVRVYEVGEADGALFIAMELVPGGSLRARLTAGRRMTVDEAIALGRKVARGLAAAHAKGLVHRDLKPESSAERARSAAIRRPRRWPPFFATRRSRWREELPTCRPRSPSSSCAVWRRGEKTVQPGRPRCSPRSGTCHRVEERVVRES